VAPLCWVTPFTETELPVKSNDATKPVNTKDELTVAEYEEPSLDNSNVMSSSKLMLFD